MVIATIVLCIQGYYYDEILADAANVDIKDWHDKPIGEFGRIFFWIVQIYIYLLTVCTIIYIGEIMEWLCRGCKWDSGETAQLGVVSRVFDPFKFKEHTECSICLADYDSNAMVTVLPCDVRHYFHAECI